MKTSDFRHRISFLEEKEAVNENGFPETSMQVVYSAWAAIKTKQGREFYQAAADQAENLVRFIIRYTKTPLNNRMLIKYKERLFEIAAPPINDDEKNETITIVAREVYGHDET